MSAPGGREAQPPVTDSSLDKILVDLEDSRVLHSLQITRADLELVHSDPNLQDTVTIAHEDPRRAEGQ